jgi:proteasome lid subunit RPN8/RPN11
MTNPNKRTNVNAKAESKETKLEKTPESKAKPTEKLRLFRPSVRCEDRLVKKTPALRLSPTAWAKLLFFRDAGDTEISGFGITPPEDLLYIEDFVTVQQQVTSVSVAFDDTAVADFFETQVDLGRKPEQFARIWIHTHPGNCPIPSGTDEATFQRVFGSCDWSLMAIVAREGQTYARIRFNVGPGGQMVLPVEIDYARPFPATHPEAWLEEYRANIHSHEWFIIKAPSEPLTTSLEDWPEDDLAEFEDQPGFNDTDSSGWWND